MDRVGVRTLVFIAAWAILAGHVFADPLAETRYCEISPKRDSDGSITRRADVRSAFKRHHPCPVTGLPTGPCTGFSIDHVIPLSVGGCDAVPNLQWLPNQIKSCAGTTCKDRWERRVYLRR